MPACEGAPGCRNSTVVQWRRRLTPAEATAYLAQQETLRAWALHEAPDGILLGPAPVLGDATRAVYACADHAIHIDLAARVHAADCQACDCDPEPLPGPEPDATHLALPTGWTVPAS
jgi:hypothetical protein